MCAREGSFVCSRCLAVPFGEAITATDPVTLAEWESLLASEAMETAEPYDGRRARV